MKYRSEIDGLRALAVLPVILFHAGFEQFSGGFIGVDVFFVISGYLITTIIIADMDQQKFSITDFYERRARRILPALFFMMLICLPFAWFWLLPSDLKDFGQSLIAVTAFISNIMFWLDLGYFDTAAELKPLLHTWSLAVEEQYYILFPVFLLFTWRLGFKWIIAFLGIIFIVSIGIAHYSTTNPVHPKILSGAFFLLPTRVWELLIGVFIAFYLAQKKHIISNKINQGLSLLGFGMVISSIFIFNDQTPFPSFYTLIPTIGTGLLIISAVPQTLVHRILSLSIIVNIGLISYSAYLWHQPILAFSRYKLPGGIEELYLVLLCTLVFIIAYISWRWVEKPFRNRAKVTRKKVLGFSVLGISSFFLIGFMLSKDIVTSPNNLPNIPYTSLGDKIEQNGPICEAAVNKKISESFSYCYFGSMRGDKSVLLFGDSHSASISYELDKKLKKKNIKGIWLRGILSNGFFCETTLFTIDKLDPNSKLLTNCSSSFKEAMNYFKDADDLIIVNRWTMKYFPVEGHINSHSFNNEFLGCQEIDAPYREYVSINSQGFIGNNFNSKKDSVMKFLKLLPKNKNNILVYPIPEIGCDIFRLNLNHYKNNGKVINELAFPVSEYDSRNSFVINIFDNFIKKNTSNHIKPIRVRQTFCDSSKKGNCSIVINSNPLYLDDDHLSDYGAKLIVDKIIQEL